MGTPLGPKYILYSYMEPLGEWSNAIRTRQPHRMHGSWERHSACIETPGPDSLRTFGGAPNRDPCSLWGLIWGHPGDIGVIY